MIFTRVVEELNFLNEHGIGIELDCGRKQVIYFELVLFVGDNLGLHQMLGLNESFKANIFCHHCLISQKEKNTIFREKDFTLRTVENYEMLLDLGDPKVSGIKERCILHEINHFHMSKNIAVDVMHDFLEGICRYDIALILNYFIYDIKLFKLDELNMRLRGFDYGFGYNINKPPELSEKSIKNGCIIISSSEMFSLVHNLNLIIGPLISRNSEHWQLYLLLKEIIIIISSDRLHSSTHQLLETLIDEYLSLVVELFPGSFKPKHHFAVHYPRCLKLFGPLWKLCCLRFEGKHQEGKNVSKNTTSRININKTIAIKYQLYFNYRLLAKEKPPPIFKSKNHKNKSIKDLKDSESYIHLINKSSVVSVKCVHFYDKIIKKKKTVY